MITFKQIDALYWIAELGSFEAAANKLNMSQSAISKRIQELEDTFDVEIFDRSKRNARLTERAVSCSTTPATCSTVATSYWSGSAPVKCWCAGFAWASLNSLH